MYTILIILWSVSIGAVFCLRFFRQVSIYILIPFSLIVGYAGYILYWDYSLLPVAYEQRMDLTWGIVMWISSIALFLRTYSQANNKRILFFMGIGALLISSILAFFEKDIGAIIGLTPILSFISVTVYIYCSIVFKKTKK